jgi:recombination protein RecR
MSDPLAKLTNLLARLPGIGEKTALRHALAITKSSSEYVEALAGAVREVKRSLRLCRICCDLSGSEVCPICSDARRDSTKVCVVAQPQDRMAFERAGVFRGRYHVLGGVLDPLAGVGPAELRIRELVDRLRSEEVAEVIVATSPSVEGDATALYLSKLLGPIGVRVTRIASGVAVGGELEYADQVTLSRALEDRRDL